MPLPVLHCVVRRHPISISFSDLPLSLLLHVSECVCVLNDLLPRPHTNDRQQQARQGSQSVFGYLGHKSSLEKQEGLPINRGNPDQGVINA